jgi:hypothetical protein
LMGLRAGQSKAHSLVGFTCRSQQHSRLLIDARVVQF